MNPPVNVDDGADVQSFEERFEAIVIDLSQDVYVLAQNTGQLRGVPNRDLPQDGTITATFCAFSDPNLANEVGRTVYPDGHYLHKTTPAKLIPFSTKQGWRIVFVAGIYDEGN